MNTPLMARLTAPIAVVSGLLLVLAIAAAWYVRDMQQRASGPIANSAHSVIAYLLMATILLHLAAALFHGLVRRDAVLPSMTGGRLPSGADEP